MERLYRCHCIIAFLIMVIFLHQSILMALAYYVVQVSTVLLVQIFGICIGSFLLTVLAYHLIKWIPIVREMIGIK